MSSKRNSMRKLSTSSRSSSRSSSGRGSGKSVGEKHVNLKRGKSEAELKAAERAEREKVAPFAYEDDAKHVRTTIGLEVDASTVELSTEQRQLISPFARAAASR